MSTAMRPEISKNNKYWISKHRYYELRHFCLQYKEWETTYNELKFGCLPSSPQYGDYICTKNVTDKTANIAMLMADLSDRMELIRKTASETDKEIGDYIFVSVSEDRPFNYLKTVLEMPCGKDMFYDRYRKFFYILSKKR